MFTFPNSDCIHRSQFSTYASLSMFIVFMLISSINHPTDFSIPSSMPGAAGSPNGSFANLGSNRQTALDGTCSKITHSKSCNVRRSLVPIMISSSYLLGNQIYARPCIRSFWNDIRSSDVSDPPVSSSICGAGCKAKNHTAVDTTTTVDGLAVCRVARNEASTVVLDGVNTKDACKSLCLFFLIFVFFPSDLFHIFLFSFQVVPRVAVLN